MKKTISISIHLANELERYCKENDITQSAIVEASLSLYLASKLSMIANTMQSVEKTRNGLKKPI
jgi:hypothetical protein